MTQKPDFEALFNASPYPYLLMAASDLTIIGANGAYLRVTGRKAEDLAGKCIFDAFPANPADPDSTDIHEVRTSIERAIATGLPDNTAFLRYAVPSKLSEGGFDARYWSTVHTPVFDAHGKVAFVAQNPIDVTDLYTFNKKSQVAALEENVKAGQEINDFNKAHLHEAMTRILNDERSHLRTLFNQAPGFIAVLKGRSHVFEIVNKAYYELVGHRDLLGKSVWEALPDVAGQGFEELLDGVFQTGQPFVGRGVKLSVQPEPAGPLSEKYIDLLYQPIFGSDGRVTGIFAQGHDVTETYYAHRSLAEKVEQLEKARARQAFRLQLTDLFRHLSDPSEILVRTSDLLGRHLNVCRVLCGDYDLQNKLVTYHSNYTGGAVAELNGTYAVARFGANNFASLEDRTTWICDDLEHDSRTAGADTWPTFEALDIYSAVVVPLSRNGTLMACLFINDSKPRKWTDDEIALIEDVAERTWGAVERIRAEEALRQADRRKDQFLAMLAHELRNPLAPISAAAELLKLAQNNPDRVRRTSEVIARQVSHMTGLVDDLLDVSRVTRGLIVLHTESVDIKAVVSDAVEQVRPLIEARSHHFKMHIAPDSAYVSGDYKRLVQVLANLINNAAKYTPEGGSILVQMDTTEEQVILRVSDNGIGIARELLPHIFELFAQAERSSDRSQGGLGLGLALVKNLVELHGGGVSADSKGQNAGSEFTVRLQRIAKKNEHSRINDSESAVPKTNSESLRLMVVDDNIDAARMLAILLETNGHQVTIEHDPCRALERARHETFDAYLLDIGLPGMDGNELVRCLRALPSATTALMVAITGYGQQFEQQHALECGFDHYLIKPADPMKLVALLADVRKS